MGCAVQTDFELLKQPKKLDLLIVKKGKIKEKLSIFHYFLGHNLISYKSFQDNFSETDIRALDVYHRSYLNSEKDAKNSNTTMTLIVSQKPVKFLKQNRQFVSELSKGHYLIDYNLYQAHIINLEEIAFEGIDGVLLSEFVKDTAKIAESAKLQGISRSKNIIDILSAGLNFRRQCFEGVSIMGAVADVTDIVLPKIEEAEKRGIEKGKAEGRAEERAEVAKTMLLKGLASSEISKFTGLSEAEINELKSEMDQE